MRLQIGLKGREVKTQTFRKEEILIGRNPKRVFVGWDSAPTKPDRKSSLLAYSPAASQSMAGIGRSRKRDAGCLADPDYKNPVVPDRLRT